MKDIRKPLALVMAMAAGSHAAAADDDFCNSNPVTTDKLIGACTQQYMASPMIYTMKVCKDFADAVNDIPKGNEITSDVIQDGAIKILERDQAIGFSRELVDFNREVPSALNPEGDNKKNSCLIRLDRP